MWGINFLPSHVHVEDKADTWESVFNLQMLGFIQWEMSNIFIIIGKMVCLYRNGMDILGITI